MNLTARSPCGGAGCGGQLDGGDLAGIDITQLGRQNAAPEKASKDTRPVARGACAATKVATRDARSRMVPSSPGSTPKSASAHRVQRGSDAQRVADAPIVFAVLVRFRTDAGVMCSYAQSASAHAIAASEYR